jgi:predicted HTH transcriptional regulator
LILPEFQRGFVWNKEKVKDYLQSLYRGQKAMNAYMDSLITEEPNQAFTVKDYIAMEGETVEFKQSLRWDVKLGAQNKILEKMVAKTIAAFMNSKGGTLVVGVSDEGDVVGLEADMKSLSGGDIDAWEQHLRNVLNTSLSKETCALVEASFPEVDQKVVAVLRAERQLKPVYLTDAGAEFYIRSGNTTQQLGVKQAVEYIKEHFPPAG